MGYKTVIMALLTLAVCVAASAVEPPKVDPMELVKVEQAFGDAAQRDGTRQAFLTYLAEDGIVFMPGPVNGKEYYEARQESASRLSWQPEYAEITSLGEMGWTTGPWEWREDRAAEPSVFGQYVSIWKRQPGGEFKLVLDIGTSHPGPGREVDDLGLTVLDQVYPQSQRPADLTQEREELLEFDRQFSKAAELLGVREAFPKVAAEDILLLRDDFDRLIGHDEMDEHLSRLLGAYNRNPEGARIARSGELGYTWGLGRLLPKGTPASEYEDFAYASIWRLVEIGRWELAVDVMVKLPKSEGD
jgi:hypothetical protein